MGFSTDPESVTRGSEVCNRAAGCSARACLQTGPRQVGLLTPPSSKLKSGCSFVLDSHRSRKLFVPFQHPAPLIATPSPVPYTSSGPLASTTFRFPAEQAVLGTGKRWWQDSRLIKAVPARCLGGKNWCEAGEGSHNPWHHHLGLPHSGRISRNGGERGPNLGYSYLILTGLFG